MSEAGLRILVLADAQSFHTERFVAELRRQGCDVLLASLEHAETEQVRLRRRFPIATVAYALAAGEVERLIEAWRPHLISAHYAAGYGYLSSRLCRSGIPVTLHIWGSDVLVVPQKSWLHKRKVVKGLQAADHLFADSMYLAGAAARLTRLSAVSVYPWGIERQYLRLQRQDYTIGRPLRVIVPRMHELVYDNEFIVEALREEIRHGDVQVMFPAFGSRFGNFRTRVGELGLPLAQTRDQGGDAGGATVLCYEKRSREEFLAMMAAHDVYLSAAQSDSSPVSLIEAMALGLLPVAADIPGVREWLTEESGFRYRPGDQEGLRRIIQTIRQEGRSPETAFRTMRRCNRERVEREGIFEDNIAAQVAVMRDLVRKGRS